MSALNKMYPVPNGWYLRVQHLHSGNSTKRQRHNHEYMTIAKLIDEAGDEIVATSECSRHDTPSRKRGRDIAVGRVLKKFEDTMSSNQMELPIL